jgi:hypothetical protein
LGRQRYSYIIKKCIKIEVGATGKVSFPGEIGKLVFREAKGKVSFPEGSEMTVRPNYRRYEILKSSHRSPLVVE